MFDHYGVIRASLQYVQLDLFKHRACVYSSYWKVCHLPPCVIFVSILGRPPCPDSTRKILMNAMKFVMYEKPLFWIEAMSILGKADEVSAILEEVIEWPALAVCPEFVFYNTILRLTGQTLDPMNELTLFIRDAVRFISACLYLNILLLLNSIYQLFHPHPSAPSLVKSSAQGFPALLPSMTAGLLNGRRSSLLQSTTNNLWSALSGR